MLCTQASKENNGFVCVCVHECKCMDQTKKNGKKIAMVE